MGRAFQAALGIFVFGLTAAVIAILGALWWASVQYKSPGPNEQAHIVLIAPGSGAGRIAGQLYDEGVFDSTTDIYIFRLAARIFDAQDRLKAGEYEIPARASIKHILALLHAGKTVKRQVTVREGLTSFEIVQLLQRTEHLSGKIGMLPPEGTLLPETYSYQRGESRENLIERMQTAMARTLEELWPQRAKDLPFDTKEEALVLASIVEKETGVNDERRRVAGVFINRLRIGMPLQTDPTVIYALTKGKPENEGQGPLGRRLLRKDLDYDSPYNTYLHPGLPPGPIANPGEASIAAALNPENHDYLYFVADGTGGHAFAKTLAEHNRNVAKWRAVRRSQKK